MTKSKKIAFVCCALALIVSSLWIYWERPMTMDALIPEENWTRVELRKGAAVSSYYEGEFEDPELDRILSQMGAVRLTRAEKRNYPDDEYFQILLFKGESYPTMIYAGSAGYVQIAAELDFDHWKCYEGGEEFYRWLESYSHSLSAVYSIE